MKGHMYTKRAGSKGMGKMKYNSNGGSEYSHGKSSKGNKYGSVKGGGKSALSKSMHRKGVNY